MVFNQSYTEIDESEFHDDVDWTKFYGDTKELVPPDLPKPRNKPVDLRIFWDSDNAGGQNIL